jgi:hypothetical protein
VKCAEGRDDAAGEAGDGGGQHSLIGCQRTVQPAARSSSSCLSSPTGRSVRYAKASSSPLLPGIIVAVVGPAGGGACVVRAAQRCGAAPAPIRPQQAGRSSSRASGAQHRRQFFLSLHQNLHTTLSQHRNLQLWCQCL